MKNPNFRLHPAFHLFGRLPMWLSTVIMASIVFQVVATLGAIIWIAVR